MPARLPSLAAAAALALSALAPLGLAGCQSAGDLVARYPAAAPLLGGRPSPSPFALKTGNVRGFVFGAEGVGQPVPLAFVSTGSISAFTGNPAEGAAVAEERDDGKAQTVMHDFNDGKGAVPAERRVRQKPGGPEPFDKYVYLRKGEFFLEGVPEGVANLTSSFGNIASPMAPVTVYAGATVTDVAMSLTLPTPVALDDGSTPHVLTWTGLNPETGVTLQVQRKETTTPAGTTDVQVQLNYKPDPPDVAVELKAPPGSGGTTIREVRMTYVWTTPADQAAGKPPRQLGPIAYPISPTVVPPAQSTAFGPPVRLTVPVGSSSLQAIFQGDADAQPGLVIARVQFVGADGFAIQDKSLNALEISTVLRSL